MSVSLSVMLVSAMTLAVPVIHAAPKKNKARTEQSAGTNKAAKSPTKKGKSVAASKGASKGGKKQGKSKGGNSKNTRPETSADVKRQQESAQREVRQTQQRLKENEAAVKQNLTELGKLQDDIDTGKKKVAEAGGKVTALQKQITALQSEISTEEKELSRLRAEYLKAVKKMRAKRKEKSMLAFVFSSSSFNEALRRMRYLKQFSSWRENRSKDISVRVTRLKKETEKLAQTKSMHDRALEAQLKAQRELQTQYNRQDAIVVELKKNGQALRTHLSKKQAEVNTLRNRVSALIAAEQRKAEAERIARERAEAEREARVAAERLEREQQIAREEEARSAAAGGKLTAETADKTDPKEKQTKKQAARPKAGDKKQQKKSQKKEQPQKKGKERKEETRKGSGDVSYAEARRRRPKSNAAKPGATEGTAPNQAKTSTRKSTEAATGGFENMRGSLPRPVSGAFRVTSRFGRQSLPDLPNVSFDNPGIDAEVAAGAAAQAVFRGKVSGVYMVPGYSTVVIVNHGGYYTVYGNIAQAAVKVGDNVTQGQSLGRLAPDEDDPSHSSIHFEVWKNRDKLDPLGWIR